MLLEELSQKAKKQNCIKSYKNIITKANKNDLDFKMLSIIYIYNIIIL